MSPGIKKMLSLSGVFLSVWLGIRFLLPLCFPFLLGTGLALAAEPMVSFLRKRVRMPRAICAGIGVTVSFSLLALLFLTLCAFLLRELKVLAGIIPDLEQTAEAGLSSLQSWLLKLTARTPQSIQPLLSQNVNEFFSGGTALLNRAVKYLVGLAGTLLTHVPDSALTLGTAVISGFMISAKLPKIKAWLARRVPKEKLRSLLDGAKRIKSAIGGWLLAQVKLMGVTFTILMLGFLLLRISYGPLWALAVSLVDAFPVLGTGTVLLPWALVCFLQQDMARAVGLLGIYIVVSLTRSALEPRLVGRHLGLDPLVTLITLYAGYKIWGLGGMILAPLLAVTAVQAVPERKGQGK